MDQEVSLFKALSDETRIRLMALFAVKGEICVCHLAGALQVPDYQISRHLKVLRAAGMVEARREGTWMHYKLAESSHPFELYLQQGFQKCLLNHPKITEDLQRLNQKSCC